MTHLAIDSFVTARIIIINHILKIPIEACIGSIVIVRWVPSIILKVMGIHTFWFIMLGEIERAELGFIVEHVEIGIILIIMNQIDPYLFFTVCKWTEISILAFLYIIWVMRTEFFFVTLILVELLNSRMGILAVLPIWTLYPI